MADVLPSLASLSIAPVPGHISHLPGSRTIPIPIPPVSASAKATSNVRSGHLNLDVFSPVNQNGSFEFDRVLKSGEVYKRARKTKQWKKFYLVLRPNLLSIYKNVSEERLHKQISLSDLTAVANLKDPKGRREHVFGLFSPPQNFLFRSESDQDAQDWVSLIRNEARIDEEEPEMHLTDPANRKTTNRATEQSSPGQNADLWDREQLGSSSPEPATSGPRSSKTRNRVRLPGASSASFNELEYSGNELGSYSDYSDPGPSQSSAKRSSTRKALAESETPNAATSATVAPSKPAETAPNANNLDSSHIDSDDERVVWQGYLLCLKTKGRVRQWKKLWVVLRPKNLAFYKDEEEYAAHLLVPLSNIISAVEIDPVSKSKSYCMQIIAEEKSYRFCALSEEDLAKWLGALKSQLAKRKEVVSKIAARV